MIYSRTTSLGLLLVLPALYLAGCAATVQNQANSPALQNSNTPSLQSSTVAGALPDENSDLQRLAALWLKRSKEKANSDFPVGTGDVIEISVPAVEELRSRTVRISGDGTIALPFIGKLNAAGLTEEQLQHAVVERLKQYMHSPRVIVFVKEYRSRQVAVLGSVGKPGLYSLTSGADTLLDVISQAGGISPGADPKLYLIPEEPAETGQMTQVTTIATTVPQKLLQQEPAPLALKRADPILIDLKQLSYGGNNQYMSLQIRPGDVIMVPGGGQVLVEGWVEKPGAYPVSPGLTVTGVVVQAGGPMYPANVTSVKVLRADKGATKSFIFADLQKIKLGEAPDIVLQGGDIVEVSSVTSKAAMWGIYRFFTAIISVGVGANIPIIK